MANQRGHGSGQGKNRNHGGRGRRGPGGAPHGSGGSRSGARAGGRHDRYSGDHKERRRDGGRRGEYASDNRYRDDKRGQRPRKKFDGDYRDRSRGSDDRQRDERKRSYGQRRDEHGDRRRDYRSGQRSRGAGERRQYGRSARPAEDSARLQPQRPEHLRAIRQEHEDPQIPEGITERDLPIGARNELKTLSKDNAEFVAKHLAMVALLIDSDPQLAHQHALSASRRGGRIAMVRETLAITAYNIGDFALALRELRTYRRISGRDDQIALMVDSERGLGRPDRALELGRSINIKTLDVAQQVQLAIVMSGARLDQGQPELALAELEIPQLDRTRAYSWSPALFSAYATVLEDLGRDREASDWNRAATIAAEALEAAEHDEFEALEVINEANPDYDPQLHGDPEEAEETGENEAAGTESESAGPASEAEPEPATPAEDPSSRAAIEEAIEAEYREILASIDADLEDGGADATPQRDEEESPAASETENTETSEQPEHDPQPRSQTGPDNQPSLFDF